MCNYPIPSDTDLAYIAGIIDGEGCITIIRRNITPARPDMRSPSYGLRLTVNMCDREPVLFLQECFPAPVTVQSRPSEVNRSPRYRWYTSGLKATHILHSILPYLKGKRDQAEIGLDFMRFKKSLRVQPRNSHPASVMERFESYRQAIMALHGRPGRGRPRQPVEPPNVT